MEIERRRGAEFPKRDGGRVSPARAGVSDTHFGKSSTARAGELSRPGTGHRDAKSAEGHHPAFGGQARPEGAPAGILNAQWERPVAPIRVSIFLWK